MPNNTSLTELEIKMLRNIALNDYTPLNGGKPSTESEIGAVWSNCLDCGPEYIASTSIPGVVSSLVKKGLAYTEGRGKDAVVGLTSEGFEAFMSIP